jgi:hypothetical protein
MQGGLGSRDIMDCHGLFGEEAAILSGVENILTLAA